MWNMNRAGFQQALTGLLAVIIVVTVCAMWIIGQEVPENALTILTLVIGYFFGHISQNGIAGSKTGHTDDGREYDE